MGLDQQCVCQEGTITTVHFSSRKLHLFLNAILYVTCSAVRRSSAGAPTFSGQPELRAFSQLQLESQNDKICGKSGNFVELALATGNGQIHPSRKYVTLAIEPRFHY